MAAKTHGFSIAHKLGLLAGVPVVGALVLAWIVVSDARQQVQSAAALGSVEDLAKLAGQISGTVHQLQLERAHLAWHAGEAADKATHAQFERTDRALAELKDFLAKRDASKLPPRLARDLRAAQEALAKLPEQRTAAQQETADPVRLIDYYSDADKSLISAIAALMQLSDHGELLRTISTLVSVLQIKESASEEHAVLANVFQSGQFAPGAYKGLVTLVTEYASNEGVLYATADDVAREKYKATLTGEFADKTAAMRKAALETMDDDFGVDAAEWFALQGKKVKQLRILESELNARVKTVALRRLAVTQRALTTGTTLSTGVLLSSILLAWLIGRGVSRSVSSLTGAAAKVQRDKDYSARAQRVSGDELGMLTEAFNEMLAGIQARDSELEHHRENLEKLVEERTAELTTRNNAMRVVLDNVEQGLATVHLDGSLSSETSQAFVKWFGAPAIDARLHTHLEHHCPQVAAMTEVAWDCVAEDMLPWELSLEQMPSELVIGDRHYRLAYRGIVNDDTLEGALLVASDVTEELAQARREAVQQEMLRVFSRMTEDRNGFVEFLGEVRRLVGLTRQRGDTSATELMRTVHTIKGNCNIFGVNSVANAAHDLESFIVEHEQVPEDEAFEALHEAFSAFEARVGPLLADGEGRLEITQSDLDSVVTAIQRGEAPGELTQRVLALRHEPVKKRLARIGEQAAVLAKRLGKGTLAVSIEADEERVHSEAWSNFFAAMVHAVRNAVDHGIESPPERDEAGKPERPTLALRFKSLGDMFVVELTDDGRGIDWDALARKAKALGMPCETEEERMATLFTDGVSSREQVTDQSGRGVGMAALREAVETLGGQLRVDSEPGKGTTLSFTIPRKQSDTQRQVA